MQTKALEEIDEDVLRGHVRQATEAHMESFHEQNRKNFEQVWEKCKCPHPLWLPWLPSLTLTVCALADDANHNGELEFEELQQLMVEFLDSARQTLPDLLRKLTGRVLELTELEVRRHTDDDELIELMKEEAQARMQTSLAELQSVLDKMNEMPEQLTEQAFGKLDANHDGRIVREEFLRHYPRTALGMLQPDLLMRHVTGEALD